MPAAWFLSADAEKRYSSSARRLLQSRPLKPPAFRRDLLRRLPQERVLLLRELGAFADEQHLPLYLVGGVVRDLLLKRKNWDLDLTVEGDGMAFARAVAARYRAGLAVFERFATARLTLPNGQKLDIASTRRESYAAPAALPDVEPASLSEDLYRRDFTINAMAIRLNVDAFGRLHDPFDGQRDLTTKILRVLHDDSFCDDPTRIFRAIRFAQRFGFRLDAATRRLLARAAATNLIMRLSGPRLCNEILLLLGERRPDRAIGLLVRLQLLRFLHPRLRYTSTIKRLVRSLQSVLAWWEGGNRDHRIDRSLAYLMALLSETGPSVVRSVTKRLQLSSVQCCTVEQAGRATERNAEVLSRREALPPSRIYRLLADMSEEALALIVAKSRVLEGSEGAQRCRRRVVRYMLQDRHVAITLTGDDLSKLGLKPGPQYRKILDRVLDARLDGEVTTEADERELADRLVKQYRILQPA